MHAVLRLSEGLAGIAATLTGLQELAVGPQRDRIEDRVDALEHRFDRRTIRVRLTFAEDVRGELIEIIWKS